MSASVVEQLPQLLRLAVALTGDAEAAERLVGEALARRPSQTDATFPLPELRRAVVERFLAGSAGNDILAVRVLTALERLTPAELAATLDRPEAWVRRRLGPAPTELPARLRLGPTVQGAREAYASARGHARRSRRRVGLVVVAGALAVLLVVLAPGAIRARWPVGPRPTGRWLTYARLAGGSAWTVAERVETPTQESVTLVPTTAAASDPRSCTLVLADGDTPGPRTDDRSDVRVNGHRGVLRGGDDAPAVRWAYAHGGVADLSCAVGGAVDRNTLLGLAADVGFRAEPVLIPYRLPGPPDPYRPARVTIDPGRPGSVAVTYTAGDTRWSYVTMRITADHGTVAQPGPTGDTRLPDGVTATTLGGRAATLRSDRDRTGLPEICLAERTGRVCLTAYWTAGDQSTRYAVTSDIGALLEQTAGRLEFAPDLFDRDTWFDAEQTLR